MEKMYLQSVTRYTNNESGVTGYEATYSNGLDFEKVDFQIEDGQSIMNIPTIIKTPMTVGEIEELTKCGSVCDHKDTYIVSGVFGGKWCEKCKEMVDKQTDD